jgi:hypothetical protein
VRDDPQALDGAGAPTQRVEVEVGGEFERDVPEDSRAGEPGGAAAGGAVVGGGPRFGGEPGDAVVEHGRPDLAGEDGEVAELLIGRVEGVDGGDGGELGEGGVTEVGGGGRGGAEVERAEGELGAGEGDGPVAGLDRGGGGSVGAERELEDGRAGAAAGGH